MPQDLGSENLSLQPTKDRGPGLRRVENKMSWRMKAASAIAATAAAFGIGIKAEVPQKVGEATESGVRVVRQVGERIGEIGESKPTAVQLEALELLRKTPEDQIINATVKQIIDNGKVIPANVRNKPSSFYSKEPSDRTGHILFEAAAGTEFRGIVVEGDDPRAGGNPLARDSWLYVNNTDDPQKGGFIHIDNLNYDSKILQASPIKLKGTK